MHFHFPQLHISTGALFYFTAATQKQAAAVTINYLSSPRFENEPINQLCAWNLTRKHLRLRSDSKRTRSCKCFYTLFTFHLFQSTRDACPCLEVFTPATDVSVPGGIKNDRVLTAIDVNVSSFTGSTRGRETHYSFRVTGWGASQWRGESSNLGNHTVTRSLFKRVCGHTKEPVGTSEPATEPFNEPSPNS